MESSKQLCLLGVSFRTAPVAVREALRFQPEEAAALQRRAIALDPGLEAFVISTCNRTEFYLAAPAQSNAVGNWLGLLRATRPDAPILREDCQRYQLVDTDAARHLFRVAGGLDSAILGDVQILGQVKKAMAVASGCGSLGGMLHQLLVQAIRAGKRARSETRIGWGSASLGSALAGILAQRDASGGSIRNVSQVLIIGAGEIARDIGRHLAKAGGNRLCFLNRTLEKAEQLAQACGGDALGWADLESALVRADVVIAATSSAAPVINRSLINQVVRQRGERKLLIVDAGVPRNVEEGVSAEVMDIDLIRESQEGALTQRRAAVPQVELIVEEELAAWVRWKSMRPIEAVIKSLYTSAREISRETAGEIAAHGNETPAVDHVIHRNLCRLLGSHARALRKVVFPAAPSATNSLIIPSLP